jgi:twitching motility protein PilT
MYESSQLQLEQLFGAVTEKGASDLYLTVGKPPVLRIHGELLELTNMQVMTNDAIRAMLIEMVPQDRLQKFDLAKFLDFAYAYKEIARFRISAYFQKGKISLAMRYIPKVVPTIDSLRLPNTVKSFATAPAGLVLFVSPKGSGKSTTIASLLDFINHTQTRRIITVEHPIEYVLQNDRSFCEQQEVGVDVNSVSDALIGVQRGGFDIVMVSKMDSPQTIEQTIAIAESGHLVFATLGTQYAADTINWIIDLYPPSRQGEMRTRLSSVLTGIVTQKLVPSLEDSLVPACEIMISNLAVKNIIRDGKTYQLDDMIATGAEEGMISMDRSLAELVQNGLIAKEEAINHVKEIPTFESLLQG